MQERQRFEENWRDAFEGAEVTPPDQLWSKLELDLLGNESRKMKERVVFYQRLAAALVVVSASLGIYVWNRSETTRQENLLASKEVAANPQAAESQPGSKNQDPSNSIVLDSAGERSAENAAHAIKEQAPSVNQTKTNSNDRLAANTLRLVNGTTITTDTIRVSENSASETPEAPLLAQVSDSAQPLEEPPNGTEKEMTEEEAVRIIEEHLKPVEEKSEKRTKQRESFWLAMGGSAGTYNPTAQPSGPSTSLANNFLGAGALDAPGQTNRKDIGSAYSVGVSLGKKVSERWVIQSGIAYVNQTIDYSSNVVAFSSANRAQLYVPEYQNDKTTLTNLAAVTTTSPYTINSDIEMVSIPVQAGYLIIDRRFGWLINAGFSSDLFIRNTLVDESGTVETFSQAAGKESPYRSVNWSGLMNSELSYRVGENYRLALVPGLRYTLNSILKDGTSMPLVLDVGFRFRYAFK